MHEWLETAHKRHSSAVSDAAVAARYPDIRCGSEIHQDIEVGIADLTAVRDSSSNYWCHPKAGIPFTTLAENWASLRVQDRPI